MSLKEEGTHNHNFKINSRRQTSLVLGSAFCWWSHCFERTLATLHLKAFEVWQWLGFVGRRLGLFTDDNLRFNHNHEELGRDLTLAEPCRGLSLCWSICLSVFLSFLFLGWGRTTPLSTREVLQWGRCLTQARLTLGVWWFFRIILTNSQRPRTKF